MSRPTIDATHEGKMFGLIPCYISMADEECPEIEGKNFVCDVLIDVCEGLFSIFCLIQTNIDPEFEPLYPIQITKEISSDQEES